MSSKRILIGAGMVVAVIIAIGIIFAHGSSKKFGSVTSPDITSTNFTQLTIANGVYVTAGGISNGGIQTIGNRITMTTATTTVCAIQSPNATSSLAHGSALFTISSTTASTVTMAQATTAFATTTQIGTNYAIAANAQAVLVASSTIFSPSNWFVVSMAGGVGNFSPTGVCTASFTVLN